MQTSKVCVTDFSFTSHRDAGLCFNIGKHYHKCRNMTLLHCMLQSCQVCESSASRPEPESVEWWRTGVFCLDFNPAIDGAIA